MKRKYSFRFQRILNLMEKIEEQNTYNLAVANAELKAKEADLDETLMMRESLLGEEAVKVSDGLRSRIRELRHFSDFLFQLGERAREEKEVVVKHSTQMEKIRSELLESMKERESWSKLREKDLDNHKKELHRREEIRDGEIALRRSGLNSGFDDAGAEEGVGE